ncbi:glycosyltransferase family 4 protein [Aequorivita echinoideorum]|uniref:Glycosyltransferase family 4 protein n=2 Tax=Aequorivita echinoideorum TaxID=1549647 RepID=A0ABS5S7R5_9FLAO|nr:glycosyltransferase family 4 protein [Aequorivita echinoideorum]
MDYFYWMFDAHCKERNMEVDWFFPNTENHGDYGKLNIISAEDESIESLFLKYLQENDVAYSHIITHFLEICTPFYKEAKQNTGAKIIAVDHNPRPLNGYPIKKKILKRIKGLLYSKYMDVFVGVSRYTINELKRDFGKQISPKCQVIYNGIPLETIKVREKRNMESPKFLVASHLRESKGIQDLIASVAKLSEKVKENLIIDVYGEGPFESRLLQQVKELNVLENFNFKGSSSQLHELFHNYDYLLHPTYMECFSLTLLESLAANVPVVTTAVGGNTEVISNEKNGYIFPAKNVEALKYVLTDLLTGKKSIQTNTRHLVENNFTLDLMVGEYLKLVL